MPKIRTRRAQLGLEILENRDLPSSATLGAAISLGSAADYGVLGLSKAAIVNVGSTITGDEGVSKGGILLNVPGSTITGDVLEAAAHQYFGHGKVDGSITVNAADLSQADSAALAASAQAAALSATQTLKNVNSPTTLTGNGGLNVIDISGDIRSSLTLKGTANDVFIINVKGSIESNARLTLGVAGGVTAGHVLYNLVGAHGQVDTWRGDVIDGTLLGPDYSFDLGGQINGEIIGGREVFLVGAKVTAIPFSPPVASTTGSLSGFVLSSIGSGILNITVDLEDSSGNILQSTTTNSSGAFSFTGLQPGSYQLVAVQTRSWVGISSAAGTVNGAADGSSTANNSIGSITLPSGGAGTNFDFTMGSGG